MATDRDGNVYIAGTTEGSQGDADAWVAKYSATGALRWKRQLGMAEDDWANGIATDGAGNVYIAGGTSGSLGGPNQGDADAWVAKYSATGALRWVRQLGTSEWEVASGLATDGNGHLYMSGGRWVAKYFGTGALRWVRQLGTGSASGVATDGDGNVYIAGVDIARGGDADALVAKYSAAGVLRWKRQLGTSDYDGANGVATDGAGNVYTAGWTFGSLEGPNQGQLDAWVAKYSARP